MSNIGKSHQAIRCEFYFTDAETQAQYTTNLQGEIVDVAATNVKPRLKFFDAAQIDERQRFAGGNRKTLYDSRRAGKGI